MCRVVLTFWVKEYNPNVRPFKWNSIEHYFPVKPFIMLYKVILNFESLDEILKRDHSKESYWAVISYGTSSRQSVPKAGALFAL